MFLTNPLQYGDRLGVRAPGLFTSGPGYGRLFYMVRSGANGIRLGDVQVLFFFVLPQLLSGYLMSTLKFDPASMGCHLHHPFRVPYDLHLHRGQE